jgi:arginine/lysine/ornithine decarboxylase
MKMSWIQDMEKHLISQRALPMAVVTVTDSFHRGIAAHSQAPFMQMHDAFCRTGHCPQVRDEG